MPIDLARCRKLLDSLELEALFVECLGWDRHKQSLTVVTKTGEFQLRGFAQKRGFQAFVYQPGDGGQIPDQQTRAAIDREVTKVAREHVVIFTDGNAEQAWLRVHRTKGQPTRYRLYEWRRGQRSGTLLERVLPNIAFRLDEEDQLTLPDVTTRAGAAFDIEKVTKRFFERFQAEHKAFHGFIEGIRSVGDRNWYASVMLNRLMFCYFIQKKGLLDGDHDYLGDRLARLQQSKGKDKFWSFYRHFLLRLFHEGLGQKRPSRQRDLDALVGQIPYLNGGLFDIHELEREYPDIQIPDDAFERLFAFFDEYRWHLDDRPLKGSNEINPDVLGYIFEKYINQKQMGAYYTKEDITGYISQNTILPFILDRAVRDCAIAFAPDSTSSVWRLLRHEPDAYIYAAVRHGVIDENGTVIPLPNEIEAGTADVSKRQAWNKPAIDPYGLPTETWREHVARRERCIELRLALAEGKVTSVNDLVTLNLDIRQFVEDVIDRCEGPELLRAVWRCLVGSAGAKSTDEPEPGLSVLDPTCGSGAFLFAALNILEPLYEACLARMESFLDDVERAKAAGEPVDAKKFADFRATLAQVAEHPNQRYYILKSIIVNNLYGVDIMEEACEICKLRLFLKLVAQIDEGVGGIDKIEPLPDIDFNIRTGNTLVGFTSLSAVRDSMEGRLDFGKDVARIEVQAAEAAATYRKFREMQTRSDVEQRHLVEGKRLVRERLGALEDELNRYLASEYGVDPEKATKFAAWRASHLPFHWFVDFYGIMSRGGFDVIIGNPPYVEYAEVKDAYALLPSFLPFATNLYSACIYRITQIKAAQGYASFIVPVSLPSTERMQPLRRLLLTGHSVHFVSFSTRPSKLFDGAEQRLTIFLQSPSRSDTRSRLISGGYLKWSAAERVSLFPLIEYVVASPVAARHECWPKLRGHRESAAFRRLQLHPTLGASGLLKSGDVLYYKNTGLRYFSTVTLRPPRCWINGKATSSSRETVLSVGADSKHVVHCYLLSSTFFLYYQIMSNCRDLNPSDIGQVPIPEVAHLRKRLTALSVEIEADYTAKGTIICMNNKRTGEVRLESVTPARSKALLDEIDRAFAAAIGFTADELDHVINHDIKYRVGADSEESDE